MTVSQTADNRFTSRGGSTTTNNKNTDSNNNNDKPHEVVAEEKEQRELMVYDIDCLRYMANEDVDDNNRRQAAFSLAQELIKRSCWEQRLFNTASKIVLNRNCHGSQEFNKTSAWLSDNSAQPMMLTIQSTSFRDTKEMNEKDPLLSEALHYLLLCANFQTEEEDSDNQQQQQQLWFQLGRMFLSGLGTKADPEEASKWFSKSAEVGNKAALVQLQIVPYVKMALEMDSSTISSQQSNNYNEGDTCSKEDNENGSESAALQSCAMCGRTETPTFQLQMCSRCQRAHYCSTVCQAGHWPVHSLECQPTSFAALSKLL